MQNKMQFSSSCFMQPLLYLSVQMHAILFCNQNNKCIIIYLHSNNKAMQFFHADLRFTSVSQLARPRVRHQKVLHESEKQTFFIILEKHKGKIFKFTNNCEMISTKKTFWNNESIINSAMVVALIEEIKQYLFTLTSLALLE